MRALAPGFVVLLTLGLACGGVGGAPGDGLSATRSGPDLTGISGTWCHVNGYCYEYVGDTIREVGSGLKGTWRQEDDLYISQFGNDVPWVAKIEKYTATQLIVVPLDDNERIVYSKK